MRKKAVSILLILVFIIPIFPSGTPLFIKNNTENNSDEEFFSNLAFTCYDDYFINKKYEHYKEYLLNDYLNDDVETIETHEKIRPDGFMSTSTTGPIDSPWPMFKHDVRNTGQSQYSTAENPGIEKWRFKCGWVQGGAVVDKNGTIYFGGSNTLYALYPNGTLKWKTGVGASIESVPAIDENGIIYVGTAYDWDGIFAYYLNGTLKWNYDTGSIYSSPVIGEGGTIYFGTNDGGTPTRGSIYALNPNGTLKWRFRTNNVVYSSPAIGKDGTIYCGSHDKYLYALYPNGTLKWKYKTDHWVRVSPCIAEDGTVYFVSLDNYLYAVFPNNGSLKWKTHVGAGTHPSIGQDGTIYAGSRKLYAIDPTNGTKKWKFNPGDNSAICGGSPCISADGTIYFGTNVNSPYSDGGDIIALKPDGTEKWRKRIARFWVDSTPSIGADGTVYIGSAYDMSAGYLHAFGTVEFNNPPEKPTIKGPTWTRTGIQLSFKITSYDPDINPIQVYIDWGDGNKGWKAERGSGETCHFEHTWSESGTYKIRIKSRDIMGEESEWAYYTVEIVRPKFAFLFGKIKDYHYVEGWNDIQFKAEDLIIIHFKPFSFNWYNSEELIYFINRPLTLRFVSGIYMIYYPPTTNE